MKKNLLLTSIVGLATISSLSAANIAWVTLHSADNTPSPNAATAGFTQAPDIGYTNLLTAAGNTVTRIVASAAPNVATLNTYDLVIIGRSNVSSNFQTDASANLWNGITTPTIIMSGYLTRNSRLGFTTGATVPDTFLFSDAVTDSIRLTATNPLHPLFAGVTLDGGNTMTGNFATEVTYTTGSPAVSRVQQGISVNTDALAGGGTILATDGVSTYLTDPTLNKTMIAEWNAGAVLANNAHSVLGGKRMVFLSGSREQGITGDAAGIFDLSADGQKMFLNAVNYMAIPEPSALSLAGLGVLGFLRRRRA